MPDISYFEIFLYGLRDSFGPGAVTVLLFFVAFISAVGNNRSKLLLAGLFFVCLEFTAYLFLVFGRFDSFLSNLTVDSILNGTNAFLAAVFVLWGFQHLIDWYRLKVSQEKGPDVVKLPAFMKEQKNCDIRAVVLVSLAASILGIVLTLASSIWAFDYPAFIMFYKLIAKGSIDKAFPALVAYHSGLVFSMLIVWLFAFVILINEKTRKFVVGIQSLVKISSAAVYLSAGLSILYLLIKH